MEAAITEAADFVTLHPHEVAAVYDEKLKTLKTLAQPLVDAIRDLLAAQAAAAGADSDAGAGGDSAAHPDDEPVDDEL